VCVLKSLSFKKAPEWSRHTYINFRILTETDLFKLFVSIICSFEQSSDSLEFFFEATLIICSRKKNLFGFYQYFKFFLSIQYLKKIKKGQQFNLLIKSRFYYLFSKLNINLVAMFISMALNTFLDIQMPHY